MTKIWIVWRDCGANGVLPMNAYVYAAVAEHYLEMVRATAQDPENIFLGEHEIETPALPKADK